MAHFLRAALTLTYNFVMPILDPNTLEFTSRSPDQTRRLGMRLGALLQHGDVICLTGDLGAGKTTFVQGVARGWGSPDPVSSPTFILVNVYGRPDGERIYHLDAYRLDSAREAEDLDLDEMIGSGAMLVEWADRITDVLPRECLDIQLRWQADEQRVMVFSARGEHYEKMMAEFRRKAFGG
jgi:tRNA threonylcarbamoyladenosine biosynthesis protein TsaE